MRFENTKEIKTKRLVLRSFSDSDEAKMTELFSSDEIAKTYMMPDLPSDDEKKKLFQYFKTLSESPERFVRGIYLLDILIGFMNDVGIGEDDVELGYVIDPKYKNNGYATEALSAAIDAIHSIGFSSVRTGAFSENAASIRVMEKVGMVRLDIEERIEYRGVSHSCVYYAKRK